MSTPFLRRRHVGVAVGGRRPEGAHLLRAPEPNVVDGTAEYDMSGGAAWAFAVDPTSMPFSTEPIELTIRMRAHGDGDPGFDVEYVSNVPYDTVDGRGLRSTGQWAGVTGTGRHRPLRAELDDHRRAVRGVLGLPPPARLRQRSPAARSHHDRHVDVTIRFREPGTMLR